MKAILAAGCGLNFTGSLASGRDKALAYFEHNAHRLRYQHFRDLGMFVGSGVVEAGCKAIIGQRPKLSGIALDHPRSDRHCHPALPRPGGKWDQIWQRPHSQTPRADLSVQTS